MFGALWSYEISGIVKTSVFVHESGFAENVRVSRLSGIAKIFPDESAQLLGGFDAYGICGFWSTVAFRLRAAGVRHF
jgi:hypothetical protein